MIQITETAKDLIRRIPRNREFAAGAGLRIALMDTGGDALEVRPVNGPEPEDAVVEQDGARVFLGPVAQLQLSRHELDLREVRTGRVQFLFRESPR